MATEKNINARVVLKHDTEANWLKATTFVPKAGELIVYDPDTTYNYTRIKIGDGSTKVSALPFSFDKGKLQDKLTAGSNITISNNTISSPSISITNGTATTPTGDTVAVISGETASGHTITTTKVNVATKDYVDRKSVAAVQYLGTVSNANELAALNPNSVGDFCRVAAAFSSYHAGDLLLCKTLKTSSAAATWDVIHGEIDKDTWTANSKNAAGYVAAGGTNANKVWKTDASGNPAWRDDANTNTAHAHTAGTGLNIDGSGGISGTTKYSLKVASSSEIGGVKPGTTSGKTYGVAVASDGAMTVSVPWTDTNTDTKVTQTAVTASDYTNWRPLVIGSSNSNTEGFSPSNVTDGVYAVNTITCQPSSGTIRATTFKGNANTATKLATARTIGLGTGATGTATSFDGSANITIPVTSVKEAYLDWGGKSISGGVTPIGASLSSEHSANRLAYLNPDALSFEYSDDAGSTWSTMSLSYATKIGFVTTSGGFPVGHASPVTINHRSRVTITAQNGTTGYVYTRPRKLLLNVSTPHGLSVLIETKTGATNANWGTVGTYSLSGWSGWNDIPLNLPTFGGSKDQTSNIWYMRLTFAITSVYSNYANYTSSIVGMRLFGDTCWTRTSNMGETGHLYSYDSWQNATFPAAVTATHFVEGTAYLSDKYAAKSHKHSVTAAGTNSSTSITPAGTVSQPTFTGTAASHNHTFTGTAAEHTHTFTGTQATASVKYTPAGTVSSSFTGTAHNHTFSGTAATSGKPDTTNVTTIYSITGVGTLPSASLSSGTLPSCSYTAPSHTYTAPSLTGSVSNQCLTLTFNAGSHSFNAGSHSFSAGAFPTLTFSAGTLPTREAVSVPNTNHTHSVTATGTIGNATAGGTVSSTFSGTEATISHTFTPAGSISKTSLTPAGTISSKELTPAGTVSKPTFTGTAASHTHTFTGSAVNSATES